MAVPRIRKDTPQKMAEHLLCKYMDHIERDVQSGRMMPMTANERISLEMALTWICERNTVIAKTASHYTRRME